MPARRSSDSTTRPIFEPRPGSRCSTSPGIARLVHQTHRGGGDERRALCRLGENGAIARGEAHRRPGPRRSPAGSSHGATHEERLASVQRELVRLLPVGPGRSIASSRRTSRAPGPRNNEAGRPPRASSPSALGQRLAGLAHRRAPSDARSPVFEEIGRTLQDLRALRAADRVPVVLRARRHASMRIGATSVSSLILADSADGAGAVGRIEHRMHLVLRFAAPRRWGSRSGARLHASCCIASIV